MDEDCEAAGPDTTAKMMILIIDNNKKEQQYIIAIKITRRGKKTRKEDE